MKCEKTIHIIWKNMRGASIPSPIGKYQYTYSSNKGEISLIELTDYYQSRNQWEIYCLKGDLFDDVERFNSKKEAELKIKRLLKVTETSREGEE